MLWTREIFRPPLDAVLQSQSCGYLALLVLRSNSAPNIFTKNNFRKETWNSEVLDCSQGSVAVEELPTALSTGFREVSKPQANSSDPTLTRSAIDSFRRPSKLPGRTPQTNKINAFKSAI